MSVNFKPVGMIMADLGIDPNGRVQKFFTDTCAKHMDKYVPYGDGNLSNYYIEGNNKIVYPAIYAHYQYVGEVMGPNIPIKKDGVIVGWFSRGPKSYTGKKINYDASKRRGHTYAGPYWDQRMWSAESKQVIKEVQRYVDRGQ